MIWIDTNVLVRYIAQYDSHPHAPQSSSKTNAARPRRDLSGWFLIESVWVSESCYDATREEVAEIVRRLLSIKQLVVQDAEIAWKALRLFESSKADFADCLIQCVAMAAGCERVMTFDKQASKAGMTLLK